MYYSIKFKAESKKTGDKLVMVLFKTGYIRVEKVLPIKFTLKEWDAKKEQFKGQDITVLERNQYLSELKTSYTKVAEQWDKEKKPWTPKMWSHCFDNPHKIKEQEMILDLSGMLEYVINYFEKKQRYKNGHVVSSKNSAKPYKVLRNSLQTFTVKEYKRKLSTFSLDEIDIEFVNRYKLYIQIKAYKEGTKGGLRGKLAAFKALYKHAKDKNNINYNFSIFNDVSDDLKFKTGTPKTIPHAVMKKIEAMDKSEFSRYEIFWIDLFLFSYYAGGMSNIDVAFLTWDSIQDGMIKYERMKLVKKAEVPLHPEALKIINKYRHKCYANYVLPIFNHKHTTDERQRHRVEGLSNRVNRTLRKVRDKIKYNGEITWYSSRGTFITQMAQKGTDIATISHMAGNSPSTIGKHYFSLTNKEEIREQMKKNL